MDAFVEVDGTVDGIGKIVNFDAGIAEVEYFESPAGPILRTVRVPAKRIRGVELTAQTRVFWLDPAEKYVVRGARRWRLGQCRGNQR